MSTPSQTSNGTSNRQTATGPAPPTPRLRPVFGVLIGLIAGIAIAPVVALPFLVLYTAGVTLLIVAAVTAASTTDAALVPPPAPGSATPNGKIAITILFLLPFVALGAGRARQVAALGTNDVVRVAGGGP